MLSRTPERKMRLVRAGLLVAWLVLIASLLWDPLTPALTAPDNVGSPFHIGGALVTLQGKPMSAEPYPMGSRIFWTMVLPCIPLALMLFGHEAWRRVCPLSHVSQIPGLLGRQRRIKTFNRGSGRVDRLLALMPAQSWLGRNHFYFQFGFLAAGVLGRLLFYNSDRLMLVGAFAFIMLFALVVGYLYGGKTWCNYFCPVSVIQTIYTGPGGLLDSKAHIEPAAISQSMCRVPGPNGDRSACVGCTTFCSDVDLENSYWKMIDSDQTRFVYYGFFGLVFAFYTYYFVYSGGWTYYMTGFWTHESGQLATLLAPGFYLFGVAVPVPKIIAAPIYAVACIIGAYWLFVVAERGYARMAGRLGKPLSKGRLRHIMLTLCAFLTFNLFYVFAGRPNILLMPSWAVKLIDVLIVLVSATWLLRSLARDGGMYRRERLARTLRDQLVRMGFRSESVLDGQSIDRLSADEVYVLAKTLPNFTAAQKHEAYRAILTEALETGHTQSADSLKILSDVRTQLGLSDADHHAIIEALGIRDPTLLDPQVARSLERQVRHENYRKFLVDHVEQSRTTGVHSADYMASAPALEAVNPVRALFNISDDDHARIAADVTSDETRFIDRARLVLDALVQLEAARFSLGFDARSEALLLRRALLPKQRGLIREMATLVASIGERRIARSLAQSIYALVGKEAETAVNDAIEGLPDDIREAFARPTSDPAFCSYLDVIEISKPSNEVFRAFSGDRDPMVAAVAISAVASTDQAVAERTAAELLARVDAPSPLVEDMLSGVRYGTRAEIIVIMTELLAVEMFAALDFETLAEVARRSAIVSFSVGDEICRAGESSDSMFIVARGEATTWVDGDHGRLVIGAARAGSVFGELGVFTGRPRSATIQVVSPTATVVAIPRDVINELLGRDLQSVRGILNVVAAHLQDTLSAAVRSRVRDVTEAPVAAH